MDNLSTSIAEIDNIEFIRRSGFIYFPQPDVNDSAIYIAQLELKNFFGGESPLLVSSVMPLHHGNIVPL